jgi:endoglucanase
LQKSNQFFFTSIYFILLLTQPFSTFSQINNWLSNQSNTQKQSYIKIPIETNRWFVLNHIVGNMASLFDGDTSSSVHLGTPNFKENYSCIYPFNLQENVDISELRFYDGTGDFTQHPLKLFAINDKGSKMLLAIFKGNKYNQWVTTFADSTSVLFNGKLCKNLSYLVLECHKNNFPNEIELYGNYNTTSIKTFAHSKNLATPKKVLKNFIGINAFEWDFVNPLINSKQIDPAKYNAIKNFTQWRHYLDWERIEDKPGKYTFSPCHFGGWDYDNIYQQSKADSIETLVCFKNIPTWLKKSYPINYQQNDNRPHAFADNPHHPLSYKAYAAAAFQFVARYGYNKNINTQFIKVDTVPRWKGDATNEVKIGLGLVKYIECGNEPDKWWRGEYGYMDSYQYAALLSAFYDGHKSILGKNVGVKNADSSVQIVIGGLADFNTNYLQGMVEWCKQNRGYNKDGTVNLCWDIINFHFYANDGNYNNQFKVTQGVCIEQSEFETLYTNIKSYVDNQLHSMPLWITETGYDLNTQSTQRAISIKSKSAMEVQADWALRTVLTAARVGIDRLFFYQLKDFNSNNPTKYASMGLIDAVNNKRPAIQYLQQVNKKFGDYYFKQNISKNPMIDEYTNGSKTVFVAWLASQIGAQLNYSINFLANKKIEVYTPTLISNELLKTNVLSNNGSFQLILTETPIFVEPVNY